MKPSRSAAISQPLQCVSTAITILLLSSSNLAAAAGFSLTEYSVRGMGSAYAGSTADAVEPATIYWNPAGLTRLDGTQAAGGAVLIGVQADWSDAGSNQTLLANPGPPPAFVTVPSQGPADDGGVGSIAPSGYLTTAINDRVTIGIGVQVPFGLKTEYDDNWVGRYHALESSLTAIDINPSIGYRINEHWSVGLGVSAQYVDAKLTRALFTGGPDGKVEVDGDDWSFGFNAGVLYEIDDSTRIGLSFRSGVSHTLDGTRNISGTGTPLDGKADTRTDLDLPASAALGIVHAVSPQLTLMADLTWTGWSSMEEIRIQSSDGLPDDVTVSNWNDVWRAALGAAYELTPSWTLRGGVMVDQSPIPGKEERTPRVPGADRFWIAGGVSWHVSKQLSVDLAYAHLFFDDADVDNTVDLAPLTAPGAFQDTLVGSFDTSSDAVGIGLRYRFR